MNKLTSRHTDAKQQLASVAPQSSTPLISVIIPAYNEEAGIAKTLSLLLQEKYLENAEIIVVDDGSTDNTAAIVESLQQVKLIRHPFNRGYGSAICTGMRVAKGDSIFWFDSDGQHQVADLVRICKKLTDENLEYCIGVRDETSYQDPDRKLGKWLLRQTVNFSVGQNVPDFNSGLRGFRRDVLQRYIHLMPKGFGASTLTTLLMIESNHYGATVPITVQKRIGKSAVKQFRDGMRTLQIILHIVILFKPLKFFGSVGLLLIAIGAVYGVIKASINNLGIPVLALLVIVLGIQSFFFGLLCDQISALRRERFS
jgi:glycosyltransferase involved in cell wall biosynthesis